MCAKINGQDEIVMVGCDGILENPILQWEWIPVVNNNNNSELPDRRAGILKNSHTKKCMIPQDGQSNVNVLAADDCDENNDLYVWKFDFDEKHPD